MIDSPNGARVSSESDRVVVGGATNNRRVLVEDTWRTLAELVNLDAAAVRQIPPHVAARVVEHLEAAHRRYAEAVRIQAVLQRLASTDPLTGLANRREAEARLVAEVGRARRYGRALTVLMCDIDGFKQINDSYGHCAGDAVLMTLASRLRIAVRRSDVVARWGADEFLAICPELDDEGGRRLARKLAWAARQPITVGDRAVRVAISVGWTAGGADVGVDELVASADRALYQAKREATGDFWHAV